MLKKYIAIILSAMNLAATFFYVRKMPDELYPVHYGIEMQPDRYGSKWFFLLVPSILIVLMISFLIYRRCTKNNENVQKNKKYENIIIPILFALLGSTSWLMILLADGVLKSANFVPMVLILLLGVMFIVLSNYMGKLKQNRYFGIKMRATLNNITVWRKAHRLSGILGTIGGLIMIVSGIVSLFVANDTAMMIVLVVALFCAIFLFGVIPSLYAAKLYKELGNDGESVGWYGTEKKGEHK